MKLLLSLIFVVGLVFAKTNNKLTTKQVFKLTYKLEYQHKYQKAINLLLSMKNMKYKYLLNYRIGWLYFLDYDYKKSNKYLGKALVYFPNSIQIKLIMIKNYIKIGNITAAFNLIESILRKDFYNYYANYYKAKLLLKEKNIKQAKKICFKILNYYPGDYQYLNLLKNIYIDNKEFKKANNIKNILNFYN